MLEIRRRHAHSFDSVAAVAAFGLTCALAGTASATTATATVQSTAPVAAGDAPVAIGWGNPVPLGAQTDDAGYPAKSDRYMPAAATLGGTAYVAWTDERHDDPFGYRDADIELQTTTDGGRTWGSVTNLTKTPRAFEYYPSIAASDSSIVVASKAETGPVHLARLTPIPGQPGRFTTTVADLDTNTPFNDLAGTGHTFYFIGSSSYGYSTISLSTSTDDGRTWSEAREVVAPGAGCGHFTPNVAADDQLVAVVWNEKVCTDSLGRNDPRVVVSTDGGGSFTTPLPLATTPQNEQGIGVAVDGSTIVVAWLTARAEQSTTVEVSRSVDGGKTWATPVSIGDIGRMPPVDYLVAGVDVDLHGDRVRVFAKNTDTIFASSDAGASWQAAGHVPSVTTAAGVRTVAFISEDTYLALTHVPVVSYAGHDLALPSQVTDVTAVGGVDSLGTGSAKLSWAAPANVADADVAAYTVRVVETGRTVTVDGEDLSAVVSGLPYGQPLTFTVTARNAAGAGPTSLASTPLTLARAPDAPARPAAKIKGGKVVVKWRAPFDGGTPITGYRVLVSNKVYSVGPDVRSKTTPKLPAGKYKVRVVAISAAGASIASRPVTVRIS